MSCTSRRCKPRKSRKPKDDMSVDLKEDARVARVARPVLANQELLTHSLGEHEYSVLCALSARTRAPRSWCVKRRRSLTYTHSLRRM